MPPEISAPPEDGGESLAEVFWSVARALRHQSLVTLTPWDTTPSQSRALAVLSRHGEMRLSDLAEHLRIAPRSATEVVDSLQDRDLVRRQPDPHDRRATIVALTGAGASISAAIQQARRAEADRVFGALSADDRATLVRLLSTVRAAIAG